jgi:hypothetical protein
MDFAFIRLSNFDIGHFQLSLSQLPVVAKQNSKQFHTLLVALYSFAYEQKIVGHR